MSRNAGKTQAQRVDEWARLILTREPDFPAQARIFLLVIKRHPELAALLLSELRQRQNAAQESWRQCDVQTLRLLVAHLDSTTGPPQ